MWPDRLSNPGPLALEPDALPTALRGLASTIRIVLFTLTNFSLLITGSVTSSGKKVAQETHKMLVLRITFPQSRTLLELGTRQRCRFMCS